MVETATIAIAAACAPHAKSGRPDAVLSHLMKGYSRWLKKDKDTRRGGPKEKRVAAAFEGLAKALGELK